MLMVNYTPKKRRIGDSLIKWSNNEVTRVTEQAKKGN